MIVDIIEWISMLLSTSGFANSLLNTVHGNSF